MRKVPYPHPGEILLEEFLRPMEITQYRLAKEIGVPQRRIGQIVAGKRAVTADTGLRLSRFFGMSDALWIGLQMDYDAAKAGCITSSRSSRVAVAQQGHSFAASKSAPAGNIVRHNLNTTLTCAFAPSML